MTYIGNTVRFVATHKTVKGELFDPSTFSIRLLNPDGTQLGPTITSPIRESLGVWYVDLTMGTAVGRYKLIWHAEASGSPNVVNDEVLEVDVRAP